MENFQTFGLPKPLLNALQAMQFHKPTPIQAQTIPPAMEGSDILGSAQTGTGKTGAFGIALVTYLLKNAHGAALVLTPTRELALQVLDTLKQLLGRQSPIATALLIGGDSMFKQLKQLKSHPRLIVGTPGRINDHLLRGSLTLSKTGFLVLDETDRMLDMGFTIQIQKILQHLPAERQTLMFSATMDQSIVKMAHTYLSNPVRISVGSTTTPVDKIQQENIETTEPEKFDLLCEQLAEEPGSCIVFSKTKFGAERMAKRLRTAGYEADAIHGDLRQSRRARVIQDFRKGKIQVLVATDLAARGLDIPHIACVINYDLPQCPEDYIHRIGRTGRAGAEGRAINFLTSQDRVKWKRICQLINPGAKTGRSERPAFHGQPRSEERSHKFQAFKQRARDGLRRDDNGFKGGAKFSPRPGRTDRPARTERFDGADRPMRSERPRYDGPRSDRPQSDRPRSDRPRFDGPRSDRPRFDRPKTDRPRSERPAQGDQGSYARPKENRSDRPGGYQKGGAPRPFAKKKPAGGKSRRSFGKDF